MIKFFRQIRQQLLIKNKMNRYLLYAVGEIALVVIGILIALQVNNWSEHKSRHEQIKLNLENLSEAIKEDYVILELIESINSFRYHSLLHTLKLAGISKDEVDGSIVLKDSTNIWNGPLPNTFDEEFCHITFKWITRPRIMVTHSYAMEEFKSSGLYSHLEDQSMKDRIATYYGNLDWHFGNDDTPNSLHNLVEYVENTYGMLLKDISSLENPIEFIKTAPLLIVKMRGVMLNARWRASGAATCMKNADQVLEMIASTMEQE